MCTCSVAHGSSNWSDLNLELTSPVPSLLLLFFQLSGGELFALLEREGVFLEDAARLVILSPKLPFLPK